MRSNYAIKISGTDSDVLSVNLNDILKNIDDGKKYKWSILWIEALGREDDKLVLDFENGIKKSEFGLPIEWDDLVKTSKRFNQILELLLVGDSDQSKLRRYNSDDEMYSSCDYTIELVDSSYWIIHSKNEQSLNSLKVDIDGVENV